MATLAQFQAANGVVPTPMQRPLGVYTYSSPQGQTLQGQAAVNTANALADAPLGAGNTLAAGPGLGSNGESLSGRGSFFTPGTPGGGVAPGLAAPAAPNYADEYQKALAASSAGIANQFHMALSDIAQREGLAGQAVGQLPGQLNQVYNAGNANMMTGAASLDAAEKSSGLNSFMGAGAQMAPLSAAMGENKATAMSGVPLLALAVKTQMANERGALEQAHQSALADLAGQNLGFLSDQAKTANAQQYQTTAANQQHQWDVQGQRNQLDQQLTLAQLANDSRVEPKTNMTIGEINQIKQSPQWQMVQNYLTQGIASGKSGYRTASLKDIEKSFGGVPNLMKVVALEYPGLK